MAQRGPVRPKTNDELEALAIAAEALGSRIVDALAAETGRNRSEFDIDPDDVEFPDPR